MMRQRMVVTGLIVLILAGLTGCAAVRPYEREYLSDRIMDSEKEDKEGMVDQKWLEAREGSTGGAVGAGGGCACN